MGYGMITIPTIINFYYTVIMAYAFLFLFLGFTSTLPWSQCSNDYNTVNCHSLSAEKENCNITAGDVFYNNECVNATYVCQIHGFDYNETSMNCLNTNGSYDVPVRLAYPRSSASEEFWYRITSKKLER